MDINMITKKLLNKPKQLKNITNIFSNYVVVGGSIHFISLIIIY